MDSGGTPLMIYLSGFTSYTSKHCEVAHLQFMSRISTTRHINEFRYLLGGSRALGFILKRMATAWEINVHNTARLDYFVLFCHL